jgi:hypothetical protein
LVITKELVSRDMKSTIMICLVIAKELVSRDMKSTVISTVRCAWVCKKRAFGVSLLDRDRLEGGNRSEKGAPRQKTECRRRTTEQELRQRLSDSPQNTQIRKKPQSRSAECS